MLWRIAWTRLLLERALTPRKRSGSDVGEALDTGWATVPELREALDVACGTAPEPAESDGDFSWPDPPRQLMRHVGRTWPG
jgi:hypothetical protein